MRRREAEICIRGVHGTLGSSARAACLLAIVCLAGAGSVALAAERQAANGASPIFGVKIPAEYRKWELVAPSHRPDFGELRAVLGNTVAMNAYRSRTLPFPDGAILVKLAWKHVPSGESEGAFVPGAATTIQVMVKDSRRYAATGGWGFGRFLNGEPADEGQHRTCFACHQSLVKSHDWVFTRLAP